MNDNSMFLIHFTEISSFQSATRPKSKVLAPSHGPAGPESAAPFIVTAEMWNQLMQNHAQMMKNQDQLMKSQALVLKTLATTGSRLARVRDDHDGSRPYNLE